MALPIIGAAITLGTTLIERLFPDPEQRDKATLELVKLEKSGELAELDAGLQVIVAEASSKNWLAASWRPITMLTFVVIIANNYILYPYLSLFFTEAPLLEIPPDMWDLLKIGLGGYIVGRSTEKSVEAWRGNK